MKKYFTFVNTKRTLDSVIRSLIFAGWKSWDSPSFLYKKLPVFISFGSDEDYLGWDWKEDGFALYANDKCIPLDPEYIIEEANNLDGAKPPEKTVTLSDGTEISESTIRGWAKRFGEGE
jgi:hypothetical protein